MNPRALFGSASCTPQVSAVPNPKLSTYRSHTSQTCIPGPRRWKGLDSGSRRRLNRSRLDKRNRQRGNRQRRKSCCARRLHRPLLRPHIRMNHEFGHRSSSDRPRSPRRARRAQQSANHRAPKSRRGPYALAKHRRRAWLCSKSRRGGRPRRIRLRRPSTCHSPGNIHQRARHSRRKPSSGRHFYFGGHRSGRYTIPRYRIPRPRNNSRAVVLFSRTARPISPQALPNPSLLTYTKTDDPLPTPCSDTLCHSTWPCDTVGTWQTRAESLPNARTTCSRTAESLRADRLFCTRCA
jgi:hypothetical protein